MVYSNVGPVDLFILIFFPFILFLEQRFVFQSISFIYMQLHKDQSLILLSFVLRLLFLLFYV